MKKVACLGIVVADVVGKPIDGLPSRGTLAPVAPVAQMGLHVGGCAANTGVGLARLGVPVCVLGKVGTDGFGAFLTGALTAAGVDVRSLLLPHLAPAAQEYFSQSVGLVECVVGRMVPAPPAMQQDPLLVMAEPYKELPVNARAVRGPLPPLPGLVQADDFEAYAARKLFLHNMGHAALAYAGRQAGHEFVWQ